MAALEEKVADREKSGSLGLWHAAALTELLRFYSEAGLRGNVSESGAASAHSGPPHVHAHRKESQSAACACTRRDRLNLIKLTPPAVNDPV